ncbi:MAG: PspC domain-containing protein, partial [Bacteroidota bacterium]
MPDRFKTRTKSQTGTASLEFDDFELNAARHEFLKPVEKENGKNIWNFATISGLVLLFLSMTY